MERRKLNKMVCSLLFLMFVLMIGVMPAEKVNAEEKTVKYYSIGTCDSTWGTEIDNKVHYNEGELFDCSKYVIPGQRYTAHYADGTMEHFRINRLTGPELYVKYTEPMTRNSTELNSRLNTWGNQSYYGGSIYDYCDCYSLTVKLYWKDPLGVEHQVGTAYISLYPKVMENPRTGERPTEAPTESPTVKPTEAPTVKPTEAPTKVPVVTPTVTPTEKPTTSTSVEKPTQNATGVEKETEVSTEAETMASTENTPTESVSTEVETSVEGIHTVKGQLKYKDGTPLASTYIELHSVVKTGYTDENGYYEFTGVEPGKHTLTAFNENKEVIGEFSLTVGDDAAAMVVENAFTVEADAPVKEPNMVGVWTILGIFVAIAIVVAGVVVGSRVYNKNHASRQGF